ARLRPARVERDGDRHAADAGRVRGERQPGARPDAGGRGPHPEAPPPRAAGRRPALLPLLPGRPRRRAQGGQPPAAGPHGGPRAGHHRTFFQLLPTARTYAQLPFYNLMNTADAFAQVLLVPHRIVSLRADYHWLTVSDGNDLWYSGGGATNDHVFGYAGSPAGGRHALAQVVDLSVTVQLLRQLALGTYYGHAFGGGVVRATFAGS